MHIRCFRRAEDVAGALAHCRHVAAAQFLVEAGGLPVPTYQHGNVRRLHRAAADPQVLVSQQAGDLVGHLGVDCLGEGTGQSRRPAAAMGAWIVPQLERGRVDLAANQ